MAFEVQAERDEGGLRFADAIAIQTRKSSGMTVHGFELKISRADWLNELKDPTKANAARNLVDYWWVVAGTGGIVHPAELPDGVGLIEATDAGLLVNTPAKRKFRGTDHVIQEGLDRGLVAAVIRRLLNPEAHPAAYWQAKVRAAEQKAAAKTRNEVKRKSPFVTGPDGKQKMRHDPARYNFDDGEPLDLP